jgi:hypothetical protein
MEPLVDALQLVLDDVRARDLAADSSTAPSQAHAANGASREKPNKLFLSGASLGGFIWCAPRPAHTRRSASVVFAD